MYREEDILRAKKIFDEMFRSELVKDDEVKQMQKISKMLEKLNTGDSDRIQYLDEIYKEVVEFRHIIAEKYIKIGVCLECVE